MNITASTSAELIPSSESVATISPLPHRLDYIDALRGLACLGVILYHNFGAMGMNSAIDEIAQHHPSLIIATLRIVSSLGWVGVPLFLCLSGFCLFLPVLRRSPLNLVQVDFADFMLRRAKRILPAYYLAALLLIGLELLPGTHIVPAYFADNHIGGIRSVVMHALLLHNLSAVTIGGINPSFWSMAVEWQLYLAFPIFLWGMRRGGVALLMAATFTLAVTWNIVATHHLSQQSSWQLYFIWMRAPLAYAWFFSLGMTAAVLIFNDKLLSARRLVMGVAALAFPVSVYGALHPLPGATGDICWGFVFTGLIIALSYVNHTHFRGWNPLAALKHLGLISYSVYLVHYPLLQFLHHCHLGRAVYLVGPPMAIIAGYIFFLFAEKPFLKPGNSPALLPAT